MNKIKTLEEIVQISKKAKEAGQTVGLVTGCFDILHIGHIKFFTDAKNTCDMLIVGIENDGTIKLSKGQSRPIFKFEQRIEVLSAIEFVDHVFPLNHQADFAKKRTENNYIKLYKSIHADVLITNKKTDPFWSKKKKHAIALGIEIYYSEHTEFATTTDIANIIVQEL